MFGYFATFRRAARSPRRDASRRGNRRRRTDHRPLRLVDLEERIALTHPATLGAAVAPAAPARAAPSDDQETGPLVTKSMDGPFLYSAARGQQQETLLGALATQIGNYPGVQSFGWRLAGDHALGLAQLVPVLNGAGLGLPGMKPDQRDVVAGFGYLPGSQFDRVFVDFMVVEHEQDIAAFRDEIDNGQNPEAVAYAQQNLPVLMDHLNIALQLRQELQDGGGGGGAGAPPPKDGPSDRDFLLHAGRGNQQEIILGAMATQLGSFAEVVAFGNLLVSDHAGGLLGVMSILRADGLNLPRLDPMQRDLMSAFAYLGGDDFDRAFADFMVQDHEADLAYFDYEARNGRDILARNYAVQSLPILRDHLAIALQIQQALEGGSPGAAGGRGNRPEATLDDAARSLRQDGRGQGDNHAPVVSGAEALRAAGVDSPVPPGHVGAASGPTWETFASPSAASGLRILVHHATPVADALDDSTLDLVF